MGLGKTVQSIALVSAVLQKTGGFACARACVYGAWNMAPRQDSLSSCVIFFRRVDYSREAEAVGCRRRSVNSRCFLLPQLLLPLLRRGSPGVCASLTSKKPLPFQARLTPSVTFARGELSSSEHLKSRCACETWVWPLQPFGSGALRFARRPRDSRAETLSRSSCRNVTGAKPSRPRTKACSLPESWRAASGFATPRVADIFFRTCAKYAVGERLCCRAHDWVREAVTCPHPRPPIHPPTHPSTILQAARRTGTS